MHITAPGASSGPAARRGVAGREGRLPGAVRRAVRSLERAFLDGSDVDYETALGHLERSATGLDLSQREALNQVLEAAHARLTQARWMRDLTAALAGPWKHARFLPGDVELVALTAADGELLATVPAVRDTDSQAVRERVDAARAVLRAGRCDRCGATLSPQVEAQVLLSHRPRCSLSEESLARLREVAAP